MIISMDTAHCLFCCCLGIENLKRNILNAREACRDIHERSTTLKHSRRHLALFKPLISGLGACPSVMFALVPSVDINCSTRFTGLTRGRMSHAVN